MEPQATDAVLANQGVHLAGRKVERNPPQRAGRTEGLGNRRETEGGNDGDGAHFRYLSSGGLTISAISGELKFAFVTKPTPVSMTGATFSPRSTATIVFTPR